MQFEIDVSGSDIFEKDYTICIANKENDSHIIKGFKFDVELIQKLVMNWKNGEYRYSTTNKQKGFFKVRLYCIVVYYLFKSIKIIDKLSLTICRDFHGHKNDIDMNLKHLIQKGFGIELGKPQHQRLPNYSKAHRYANLMHKDTAKQLKSYIDISIQDIEKYLKKKVTPKGLKTES